MNRMMAWIDATRWEKGKGHRVCFVRENEAGFFLSGDTPEGGMTEPWYWGNRDNAKKSLKQAQESADEYNERLGLTKDDCADILCSSVRKGLVNA